MGEEKMPGEGDARDRWIEKSAVLYDLILQSVNNDMFQHIKDLVELDDSGPKAWKLLRDVIQPNTLPMVIVLEKELAGLSMKPGDDVKPVLDKIKDIYARMAAAGSEVSQMQQCTKIISVLDNSWDNLIPTLNVQQDKWTPEWLRQQILQEDFRRRHTGGGAANKTAEGYGAAGGSRGRGGGRGRGRGRGFGRGRGRGDYNEGHGSSGGRGSTRMEGACWYSKKAGHPWFKCFSRPEGWAPPGMKPPSGERARGGAVQGSGAQGDGAQGKANPGMFLMVEDVQGSGGDVGSVGKVVMHALTHWVIDSGCTSHMTPRADLLDEVKPPGKIKFVAAASGALLPVIGVGNAKVMGANGEVVGLGNVLLVEGLSANLLSVRRLQKSKAEVTFGPTSCRAKLGKMLLWNLEEKSSCIKDLWQLPIISWKGKPPATAKAAGAAKATAGGEESAPTAAAMDAVKKVQQPQQQHGEVLAGVDATAAWAKASSGSGEADWETWHERLVKWPSGSPPVFKARYVARGFSQQQGVDLFQTFSPTPTLRVLLHVAAQRDYELHSLDFSTAFLQGSLHEEIWLRRPPGFTGSFPAGTQWSLRRPVDGLHQAPREWHNTLRTTLATLGFAASTADQSLFLRTDTTLPPFYVLVYVDDLVFATADTEALAHVKSELQKRHTCTDLGELTSYLGLQIPRDRAQRTITLTQSHMVQQILQRFGFTYSSPQSTPLPTGHSLSAPPLDESVEPSGPYPELVGCLMYLMTCTRPDLAYPLSLLARYVAPGRHRKVHWDAAKRVLRYRCSTLGMGLVLGGRARVVLTGHADASWVDDLATQRSSQGYTFSLGSGSVSRRSTRSSSVLSSSCEAEIYAGVMAAQELRGHTYLLTDLGEAPRFPPVLYVDNKAMLALCQEHRLEHRTKHIALRYFLA
ncbi:unnamed protein product [Closterium sp. NIES-53]